MKRRVKMIIPDAYKTNIICHTAFYWWTKLPKDCASKTSQEDDATMLEVCGYSYDQINSETLKSVFFTMKFLKTKAFENLQRGRLFYALFSKLPMSLGLP